MARLLFFSIFFIFSIWGSLIAESLGQTWGQMMNIMGMAWLVNSSLLNVPIPAHAHFPPTWCGWATLVAACVVSVFFLARKVKAYEVVR